MLRTRQWMVIAVAVAALCAWRGAATTHAQTPQATAPGQAQATAPVSPTVAATSVVTETWLPYTDSGSAFVLEYSPRWTAAPRQNPGTTSFTEGETKSIMLAVFPRGGRDLDALLRVLLQPPDGSGGGMKEDVTTSGMWLHLTPGKFARVSLMNMRGEEGERLVVLGNLNQETFVLGLLGNLPGNVTPGDEADLARLIDSVKLLGPGSSATPVAPPAQSSRE
jgi:hypothetical protein